MKHAAHMIIIASALLAAGTVLPQQATANEVSPVQYEMVVVGNQASGDLVSKGDYQAAVDRITSRYSGYPFATATNLCASLSMQGFFDQAEPHCNEAVRLANQSGVPAPRSWKARKQVASQQSLAYSNRGVMRVLSGDSNGAEQDFQAANDRDSGLQAPARNLVRVQYDSAGPIVAIVSQ